MRLRARNYLLIVIGIAVVALFLQDWTTVSNLPKDDIVGLLSLIGLAILSEKLSMSAAVGTQKITTSIAFIPYFAAALLFPPAAALAALAITSSVSELVLQKKNLLKGIFNTANSAIALLIACAVFQSIGGVPNANLTIDHTGIALLGRLIALAAVFFFLNQIFVGIALALMSGERFTTVFARLVAPTGANLVYDIVVSPISVLVAVLYGSFGSGGLVIGVLPLLMIRHSVHSMVKLQQANKDLLAVLVKTIETRDPYTSGHSIRVSVLARAIAEDMDLSATTIDRIQTAALVHDIGKIDAIYASIIRKEGGLTDAERHVILTHAAKGAEFLETLTSFSKDLIDGVRYHHERYDGSGYPNGLTGESIPLAARIIQLCDSIDAMLSDRPYRKALPVDHVRSELLRCAGSQFDPKIVEIILKKNTLERAAALVRPETQTKVTPLVKVTA